VEDKLPAGTAGGSSDPDDGILDTLEFILETIRIVRPKLVGIISVFK
jgi:hypothetical protein